MSQNKPNVLWIMCDQLRFDAFGAAGNSIVRTPNIDRLAAYGTTFTNAYSPCPVCIPARYSIRTGRESARTGCYCNEAPVNPYGDQSTDIQSWSGEYIARQLRDSGYRTFGIGKFHTFPEHYEPLGYEVHIHTEELFLDPEDKSRDGYVRFIDEQHRQFSFIEQLHGERTNMYYVPQVSGLPAELTVEAFVADNAVEQLHAEDPRPFFGMVSFIGPHPPCAPPIPYNRMYDPDGMPDPVVGELAEDHLDEQIPWMNHIVYADQINDAWARNLKTRYYGEISYIDSCIGRILDVLEETGRIDNTMICFFADHGDMLGDHHAWQKECFYEPSVRVPFIVSYPPAISARSSCDDLVSLVDLFSLATKFSGNHQKRDGIDILEEQRQTLFSLYGRPGGEQFKIMVRQGEWKYIYMVNGGREQLFNLREDPHELTNRTLDEPEVSSRLHQEALRYCSEREDLRKLVKDGCLMSIAFTPRPLGRLHQFDFSQGISGFTVPSDARYISQALPNTTE